MKTTITIILTLAALAACDAEQVHDPAAKAACTQPEPYRSCDTTCTPACQGGLTCDVGPEGNYTSCTQPCTTAQQCPSTGFPAPWAEPACVDGLCIVPCADDMGCPNPNVFACIDGACMSLPAA